MTMADGQSTLDRNDIQGLILRGYRMPQAAYLFYRFANAPAARAWLADLIDPVTTAAEWDARPEWCANVGLTYPALEVLELPAESLASFPADFREGMAARARDRLGDVGADLPASWDPSPPFATRGVHAMLLLSADDAGVLEEQLRVRHRQAAALPGVDLVGEEHAAALGKEDEQDREHFGFRDGISQPVLAGSGLEDGAATGRMPVAAGEFVLGHPDELGHVPMPLPEALGRNGTYAVYRKLRQHVVTFRNFLQDSGNGPLLAAKLMGRWPSGAPLVIAGEADDPELAADSTRNNDFDYTDDPIGYRCPRGAHIRRAHPRSTTISGRRHLLIRRGLPYGPPLAEGAPNDEDADRGLIGMFLNASIERQYEFVQRNWINDPNFDGLRNDRDPIVGSGERDFTWQRRPLPGRYTGLPRFVSVRGGEYFFLPSITAMRFLSATATSPEPV
jgi:Dyp-type peroxidase family